MAIKMTMADGTVIEGTAEELAKLQELTGITEETDESPKEYDKPADETSFKVGDQAQVVGATYHNDIKEGTIVKITKNADYAGDYEITLLDGSDYDYAKPEALEKVKLSEADLVFIENGREPGEYKDGDVVLVEDSSNTHLSKGDIGIISDSNGGQHFRVNTSVTTSNWLTDDHVKPIAFVEKRADKNA